MTGIFALKDKIALEKKVSDLELMSRNSQEVMNAFNQALTHLNKQTIILDYNVLEILVKLKGRAMNVQDPLELEQGLKKLNERISLLEENNTKILEALTNITKSNDVILEIINDTSN